MQFTNDTKNSIEIPNNEANALIIEEADNAYMSFDTQNGAEFVTLNKDTKLEGGDGALQFTTAGENSIRIPDNQASALIVEEAGNAYMTFITSDDNGNDENVLPEEAIKFSKHNFVELVKKYVVALELSDNNGLEDEHLPLKKNKWYWEIIDDPYFNKTYKILEFRNTNIQKVKKVVNFFK